MRHYQDKMSESSTYRMVLLGVDVAVMMIVILLTAVLVPWLPGIVFSLIALVLTLLVFINQLHEDRYHVTSGSFLVDDGEYFYVMMPIFGINLARKIRNNPSTKTRSFQYFCAEKVKSVHVYPFGIRLRAEGWLARYTDVHLEREYFETPGKVEELLKEYGKKRTCTFHIERNLLPGEEKLLLKQLDELKDMPAIEEENSSEA